MTEISFQTFLQSLKEKSPAPSSASVQGRETLDLIQHYYQIADEQERRLIMDLVKAVARRHTQAE